MKHLKHKRILNRTSDHRSQLLASLAHSLLVHEKITTTEAKAKELRLFLERLITKAKGDLTLEKRRYFLRSVMHRQDIELLVDIARANASRGGGYTKITRLPAKRSDNAQLVRIEIVSETNT